MSEDERQRLLAWVEEIRAEHRAAARVNVAGDVADQLAVINHNHRWLVRLGLISRRPMPDPLWPRCDAYALMARPAAS